MPRGGKRAGLGRPPKVFVGPREATRFELADRLTEMPGGPEVNAVASSWRWLKQQRFRCYCRYFRDN